MEVVTKGIDIPEEEVNEYIKYAKTKYIGRHIKSLEITVGDDDYVDIKCEFEKTIPFDRIRRITGYLVGTLDRFNNGKRAEVNQRVKHTTNV